MSGLTSQRPLNEGGESARNENLESQNKSKAELANFIGSSLNSSEFHDLKNIQVASQRGPFQEVRSPKNFSHRHTTGSPEFAKELTVTDDLTVSHTDDDVGDGTYRATCQDEPFGPRGNLVRN